MRGVGGAHVHLLNLRVDRPDARVRVDRHAGQVHADALAPVVRRHHELVDEARAVLSVARLEPVAATHLTRDEPHQLVAVERPPHGRLASLELSEVSLGRCVG